MPRHRFTVSLACVSLAVFAFSTGPSSAQAPTPDEHEAFVSAAAPERADALVHGAGTGGGDVAEIEPNDTTAQANPARDLPFECAGTVATLDDVDFVSVAVTEGQRIEADAFATIGALASPLDPRLTVFAAYGAANGAANGVVIAWNDDATPETRNARVVFNAPYTGTVYLAVAGAPGQAGENYEYMLAVWPITTDVFSAGNLEAEPNDDLNAAHVMALPGVMRGSVGTAADADFVRFETTGMSTLVVDLHSQAYGMPLDARVELYDRDDTRIWMSDDTDGADPRFNVVLPMRGIYGLSVTGHDAGGPDYEYILSASLQDAAEAPFMEQMWYDIVDGRNYVKRIKGHGFDPAGAKAEVGGLVVPSAPRASKPTTVLRVTPPARVKRGAWISVVNPDGRRSNSYVLTPRR
jgi:hypothetical protein